MGALKPDYKFRIAMLGSHGDAASGVLSHTIILADVFRRAGYRVYCASSDPLRVKRLMKVLWTLAANFRRLDFVVLDVFGGLSFYLETCVLILARLLGFRPIVVLHGGALPEYLAAHRLWAKLFFSQSSVIIAPSLYLKMECKFLERDIRIIPNMVQIDLLSYRVRKTIQPKLFWMRSLHPLYNPEMAIRVVSILVREYPDTELVMGGSDRGELDRLKLLVRTLNLTDRVRFVGFLDAEQKRHYFNWADIYLNTNRIDNVPVSVLEACAAGVIVVATRVGGIPYLLKDQINGLLVQDDSAEEMAQVITRVLRNPDLAAQLSIEGRKLAEQSDESRVLAEWQNIFQEVFTKGQPKRAV